ncbi:MAG: hypothetical protein U7123_08565 [Potamolinea sp.]
MNVPNYMLSANFDYFFSRINPSPSFRQIASSQYTTIANLIENSPLTKELNPKCFLQGSYDRQTSIYTINDVDIVVLCRNLFLQRYTMYFLNDFSREIWTRDEIFRTIAASLLNDGRYRKKVDYHTGSMCIKLNLGIKIEILPVIRKYYLDLDSQEPFCLYRPENQRWEDGYARYHQQYLTDKNKTTGNFIPAIKAFKHLRHYHNIDSVSFHIECLLFSLPDDLFKGNPATFITNLLICLASYSAEYWYKNWAIQTPCKERYLFTDIEWNFGNWKIFHRYVQNWAHLAKGATEATSIESAIYYWQQLLGKEYFPKEAAR